MDDEEAMSWSLLEDRELAELEDAQGMTREDASAIDTAVDPREADVRLRDQLAEVGFEGPLWDVFVEDQARYGLAVVRAWIANGEMFRQCKRRSRDVGGRPADLRQDEIESLANEVVSRALLDFRERGLRGSGWTAEGGASLKTYFVTACLYAFPNPFRRWRTESRRWSRTMLRDPAEAPRLEDFADPKNEEETVAIQLDASSALARIEDPQQRQLLALRSAGFGWAEIAERANFPTAGAARAFYDRLLAKLRKLQEGEAEQ